MLNGLKLKVILFYEILFYDILEIYKMCVRMYKQH